SFFDAGEYFDFDEFLRKAERLVDQGADFLDVGGVKAGPGPEVTVAEELERTVPAVAALVERFDLPVSVDTFRGSVARACYEVGAVVGNDISGFADPEFLTAAADHSASVVACHIRLAPRVPDPDPNYEEHGGVINAVRIFCKDRAEQALAAGIPPQRIMVDAGLDLGKTPAMSAELLRHSDDLASLGFAVFLSASNKGFLGELVGAEVNDRTESSLAALALGIDRGCRVLRAHDVMGARRVADTMALLLEERPAA
ncbi:MAG: dihydropteroate synthase, partial [Acidimicrobiales bacterium]